MLLLKEWFSNNLGFRAHILKVLIGLIYYSVGTSVKGYWPIAISGFLIMHHILVQVIQIAGVHVPY